MHAKAGDALRLARRRGGDMRNSRQDLTERIKSGDRAAVEQAYDSFFTPVMNFAYYMLYDYDTASDISQEAFLRTVEACGDSGKDVRDFKSYLFGTARNLAMDQAGRAKKYSDTPADALPLEDHNVFSDPARASLLSEQRSSVARAVRRLNEHQRVALTLRDIDGWSYNDIAEFMGLSRNAVGVLLSRARLKFKKEFRLQEIDAGRLAAQCRDLLPLMSAVLDGEATDREKEVVQEHLAACPVCRETVDEMAGASTSVRAMVPVVPALALKATLVAKATATGLAVGAAAAGAGAGISAAAKAVIGIAATLLVAGAGVGTYVGVKKVATAPAPTARVARPADGITLTVDQQPDGTGKVPVVVSVDNRPTAVEVQVDGKTVKRFDRGPYRFEWATGEAGGHTVKPVAFDSGGNPHEGTAVTFTLAFRKQVTEKIVFRRNGNLFTAALDGTGETPVTATGTARDFATCPATGQIAFIDTSNVMHLVNSDGSGLRQVTLPERGAVECAAFSRDGSYIYFARDVKKPGDTDYSYHVRFDRYDIAANSVTAVFEIGEPQQDQSIGGVFTDPAGDYLYYNHFGSDFPSSSVHRINLKGTAAGTPFLPPRTGVPGTRVVKYMLRSISADGTHVAYEKQAVMDREPPPGSEIGTSIELSACIRPTEGGDELVLDTADIAASGFEGLVDEFEFSHVDAGRYFFTRKRQPSRAQAVFHLTMYTGTLGEEPVPTGLSVSGWEEWHLM